ncbi:MAG: hypothetical protein QM752_05315 [Gammaproteobacteria bacterium]
MVRPKLDPKAKSIKRSYTLTHLDVDNIEAVKDRALNRKVVLTDSQVVRMGLTVIASYSETELETIANKVPKLLKKSRPDA